MSESMSPAVQRSTFNVQLTFYRSKLLAWLKATATPPMTAISALGVTARPQMTNIALTL